LNHKVPVYIESIKRINPTAAYSVSETAELLGISTASLYSIRGRKDPDSPAFSSNFYVGQSIKDWMQSAIDLDSEKDTGLSKSEARYFRALKKLIKNPPEGLRLEGEITIQSTKTAKRIRS